MSSEASAAPIANVGEPHPEKAPMVLSPQTERTILRSPGATVVVQYLDADHAHLMVESERWGQGARDAARLVCEALHEVGVRRVHHVQAALEASAPASCMVFEALRELSGSHLDAIDLRRAGASVMVSLDVRTPPTTPNVATDAGEVPTPWAPRARARGN